MSRYLLDVNVLLALFDSSHVSHDLTHEWWSKLKAPKWASCPLTENGFARVISNPKYPRVETTVNDALQRLRQFSEKSDHVFWPDSIALAGQTLPPMGHQQITDYYLGLLAQENQGKLATLDRRLIRAWNKDTIFPAIELIA